MSQPGNATLGKLDSVMNDDNYYYVGVKASPYSSTSVVFGLNSDEAWALFKRFPDHGPSVKNGFTINGPPFSIINALAETGYRVICSSGDTDVLWTLQRET
ncbi:unnamed protein product [Xylocopa violacea]|uniref:Uncharacterized protein n=1 Tax=Xylocopa violacea TaxID=135666 RepID=A0ABP1PHX4_XYLVO